MADHTGDHPKAWQTRDMLVLATIALVFGVLLIPVQYASTTLTAAFPVASRALSGTYFVASFFAVLVFRRPGVAFLAPLFCALVWMTTTPVGLANLALGLFLGVYCESAVALLTRYRHMGRVRMILSGVVAGGLSFLVSSLLFQLGNTDWWLLLSFALLQLLSGGLAGGLAWWLAQSIVRTGILSTTPLGRLHMIHEQE